MLGATTEIDPVALYTADELHDLDDQEVLARRRSSPAVYQELQARVRREHRAIRGLVRTIHPATGEIVDGVSVQLPAVVPPANAEAVAADLRRALVSCAHRFLTLTRWASAEVGIAELWTAGGILVPVAYEPAGECHATSWPGGVAGDGPVAEGSLEELLAELLTPGSTRPAGGLFTQ